MPPKEGMERKNLLVASVKIFKSQGKALAEYAKPTTKLLLLVTQPTPTPSSVPNMLPQKRLLVLRALGRAGRLRSKEKYKEKLIFSELDRLTNIGPMKAITAGGAHGIVASGHTVNGSICVLQRTVRSDIITSSFLQDAQQLWAVGRREDDSHKYLIVSRTRSSLILELGEDMVELEEPLFLSDEPTVTAGEIADGGLAVQVTSLRVAFVAEEKQLQQIDLDSNFPVVAASIVDSYVALLTQNGRLMLFHLVLNPTVHLQEIDIANTAFAKRTVYHRAPLTAQSIYRDMSGLMACSQDDASIAEGRKASRLRKAAARRTLVDSIDIDLYGDEGLPTSNAVVDEDELLYGEPAGNKKGITTSFSGAYILARTGSQQREGRNPTLYRI
ncbi:unnamed protein product [Cylicocyclus nassatus]|uniref:RSE1/DDB1/CPSF1 second beta-propeller domain-containing protein n=1 Tax=Cylicocyclus nassatus TaxID=53992 RepID=A0AA36H9L6_CYLNA|nr:unnamed protein product [Cylicocyclus nassatus]